jgi:iron complex outermembrane receptor protein
MKHTRNPLFEAVRYGLVGGVAFSLLAGQAAFAQNDDESSEELERIQVTGSRIKRTDLEGALPVTVIDREQIEFSGKTSVADLLRNQPINSAGSFRPQSGSTGQAAATVSLRALGAGRTLVLIDGRRAPTAPNLGQGQDLNQVPLAAVERIEILTDGASAIYGADAIGGVINIITRKDFTGAEIMYGQSFPSREGGDTEEASIIVGAADDRGSVMAGVGYNKRDIIFQRDREWSQGGASIFSNNFLNSNFTFFQHPEFGSANVPGCQGEGFEVVANGASGRCFYDFTLQAADEAEVQNTSVFARARYNINNDWSAYANVSVNRVQSFGRYAPVPSSPWLVGGFGAIVLSPGLPNHPATPPSAGGLNPNWEAYQSAADDILLLTHRFAANGPRDTSTDGNLYDFDFGVQGRVGEWDIDLGGRRVESQYNELGRNYIVSALAQPQFDSGAYNIYDPFNVPQETLQSFTATINRDARFVSREYYALASTNLFDILPAGPLGIAFGAEYRDEDYKDIFDDLQANGNITGSAGNSAFGGRDQWAVFGEAAAPITDDLELSLAVRHDDYSDFGSSTSPKLSFRYQPMDELTIRGSWGQGFRAPPLDLLSLQPSFGAAEVVHVPTATFFGNADPTEAIQITSFSIANPDLQAEESDQYALGVAFQPYDWFNGSVDYWRIEIDGRVAGIGAQQVINCLEGATTNCPPGLTFFPTGSSQPNPALGLGMEVRGDGSIVFLQSGFASLGTIETDGIDLNLRTNFNFDEFGTLANQLQLTYTNSYEVDSGDDVAGEYSLPQMRGVLSNVYSYGDFSVAWNINYIDGQDDTATGDEAGLPSWTTHDLQVNYYAPWNGRVTVGVDNLFDKDPVLDPGEGRGFNFDLYNGYGRFPYIR